MKFIDKRKKYVKIKKKVVAQMLLEKKTYLEHKNS